MDTPIFYTALFIHLTSLVMGFGAVMVVDMFGLFWIFKKVPLELVNKVAGITQRLIWVGWCGLVLSGLFLITAKGYVDNLTIIKLFFVVMLGVNGVFLHFIKKGFEHLKDQTAVPMIYKFRIGLATAVSQLGWWGAMTIGFLHRHWQHNIPWPTNPWAYMVGIVLVFGIVFMLGETFIKRNNA